MSTVTSHIPRNFTISEIKNMKLDIYVSVVSSFNPNFIFKVSKKELFFEMKRKNVKAINCYACYVDNIISDITLCK